MSTSPSGQSGTAERGTYEIRVRGHLDARWAERLDLEGLTRDSDEVTTLRATGLDQAALHGLLQRVRDLGLTLVAVIRVQGDPRDAAAANPNPQRNPQ